MRQNIVRLYHMERFAYGGYSGVVSYCDIDVYQNGEDRVVVATERDDNPGTSITNRAEYLAQVIYALEGRPGLNHFIWIEHYPGALRADGSTRYTDKTLGEHFSRVEFYLVPGEHRYDKFEHPRWRHISYADVNRLIGCDKYLSLDTQRRLQIAEDDNRIASRFIALEES